VKGKASADRKLHWLLPSQEIYWSRNLPDLRIRSGGDSTLELVLRRTHPDDRAFVQETIGRASRKARISISSIDADAGRVRSSTSTFWLAR